MSKVVFTSNIFVIVIKKVLKSVIIYYNAHLCLNLLCVDNYLPMLTFIFSYLKINLSFCDLNKLFVIHLQYLIGYFIIMIPFPAPQENYAFATEKVITIS